jgi:hypothetical protein
LEAENARLRGTQSEYERRALLAEKDLEGLQKRAAELEATVGRRVEENAGLRESLAAAEKSVTLLEGQLAAKDKDIERLTAQQTSSDSLAETILAAVNQRLDQSAKPSEVSEIKLCLDGLTRRLASLSMGGGGLGGDEKEFRLGSLLSDPSEGTIESNISQVKVKQAKAGGVSGALAKLKKLQKGGQDGESG